MFDGVDGFMGGHPFMVGKRVAELLDIKNSSRAVSNLSKSTTLGEYFDKYSVVSQYDTTDKAHKTMVSSLQKQFTNSWRSVKLIQIGGLFELIGKSRKPKAIEFGEFVNYEILPKIARTGSYSINNEKDKEILKLKAMLKSKDAEIDRVRQSITNDTLAKVIDGNGQHIYRVRRSTMAIHTLEEFAKKIFRQRDEDLSSQHTLYQEFKAKKVNEYQYFINEARNQAQSGIQMLQHLINNLNPHKIQDLKVQANAINIKRELIENLNQLKEGKSLEVSRLENELKRWVEFIDSRNQTKIQTIENSFKSQMIEAEKEYFQIAREKHALALKVRESNDTKGVEAQQLLMMLTF
jgi:prophage antirepressor-like protein